MVTKKGKKKFKNINNTIRYCKLRVVTFHFFDNLQINIYFFFKNGRFYK